MIQDLAKELQEFAAEREWQQLHTPKNVSMALVVEASELLEIFQWLTPEESERLTFEQYTKVAEEVGDIANYLIRLCDLLDLDLEECARKKIEINRKKYPADKVRGSSKKYTDYSDE